MGKIKSENKKTIIIEDVNKTYIRKYKNQNINDYPKQTPIGITMKIVNNSKVYAPKILKEKGKYIDLEYVTGQNVYEMSDKKNLIDTIIEYIVSLQNVDYQKLYKYINWKNNSEYFNYLINFLSKLKKTFTNNTRIIIELLNIGDEELEKLKKHKIDDYRKMSLINRNVSYDNMLLKFNRIYILNWEYATYGDVAHEIATHFLFTNYAEEEKKYILEMISKKLNISLEKLKKDINVYTIYEYLNKIYIEINNLTKKSKKTDDIDNDLRDLYHYYNSLAKLTEIKTLPFNEIEEIFKKIK